LTGTRRIAKNVDERLDAVNAMQRRISGMVLDFCERSPPS
jgi:hypothetical protein